MYTAEKSPKLGRLKSERMETYLDINENSFGLVRPNPKQMVQKQLYPMNELRTTRPAYIIYFCQLYPDKKFRDSFCHNSDNPHGTHPPRGGAGQAQSSSLYKS